MTKRTILIAVAGLTILAAGAAAASGSGYCDRDRFHRTAAAAAVDPAQLAQWLPAAEVVSRLAAQGYDTVTKVKVKRGLYEAHATDKDGRRMELQINPTTGDVIGFERD